MRVLLIEDDMVLSDPLADVLEGESFKVEAAYNAEEGLEYLALYEFQAIILDLGLPDMRGRSLLA